MYSNEYVALEMHRIRIHDFERKSGIGRTITEAFKANRALRRRNRNANKDAQDK
jgi:hypothetical protein